MERSIRIVVSGSSTGSAAAPNAPAKPPATPAQVAGPDVTAVGLDDRRVAIFREALAAWLTGNGVEAVLVRPDRHVFGAGEARHLLRAWSQALGAPSSTAMALA